MGEWDIIKEEKISEWDVVRESVPEKQSNIGVFKGGQKVESFPPWMEEMSNKQTEPGFERDLFPIVGDIAATMMPGPGGKSKLAKLLFKSGKAALGGAAGEYVGQKAYGEETDLGKIGEQGMWGAGGEGAANVFGKMLKPVFKWASDFTVLGSGLKESWRKKVITRTTKKATDFIEEFAPEITKSGGKVTDINDLARLVDEGVDEYKAAYEIFNDHIETLAKGPGGGVLLDDTQQLLGEVRDKWLKGGQTDLSKYISETYGYTVGSKQSAFLEKTITDEVADPDNLKDFISSIYSKGKKSDWAEILPTQRTARENLKKTIVDDISKASPEAASAKEYADKVFGEIANFKKIQNIFTRGAALRKAPSGDWFLNPTKLADQIQKNKKVINNIDPSGGLWGRLSDDAKFYRKMAVNWRPPPKSQVGTVLGALGRGGVGAGAVGATLGPQWIPVTEGFGVFSAWMSLSPKSKAVLGAIVKNTIIKPAAHTGGPMLPMNFLSMGME